MGLITKEGLLKLKAEKEALAIEEKLAIDAVVLARGYGDFSENAELDAANNWIERVRQKTAENNERINMAKLFDANAVNRNIVGFGAQVEVEDEDGIKKNYKIVSECESDLSQGKISITSPIARALNGKSVGDECVLVAPSGEKILFIATIIYNS